jgi:hypothetical protein
MNASSRLGSFSRRRLLMAAAVSCAPVGVKAAGI